MAPRVPLSTLLSQALVAFTIEFDNEAENRIAHWTTKGGRTAGPRGAPWLISQALWQNVLQYVDAEGIPVAELHARARTDADVLSGLKRWGYVVTEGASQGDLIVRTTKAGRNAQEVWRPLAGEIEDRWRARFSAVSIEDLRQSLASVREQFEIALPRYLPVVFPTQNGKASILEVEKETAAQTEAQAQAPQGDPDQSDLSVLLAQVLLHFALDYERKARISLTIAANTLRVLNDDGVAERELPRLTGVSKEGNAMALGFLARRDCVVREPDPATGRGKRVSLTAKGAKSQEKYLRLLAETEAHWEEQFGREHINALRTSLGALVQSDVPLCRSLLFEGMKPYADGWRASGRPPETLPHYPMVLHRGGYPDGS